MAPATVAALIDAVARHWQLEPDAEITLEANPSSVEADRFAGYRTAGVNRVSLGVQSLRAPALAALGRLHSVEEAKAAIAIAQRTFERASFDLIYARPKQTVMEWRAELTEALGLARGHLSLYQLTIEPDTPFAALHRAGKLVTPPAQAAHDLYVLTQELTTAAGLPAYEISNHAAPGQQSRHNRLYWRYGEYAGIGAGAHGRLVIDGTRTALSSERKPETWLARVEADGEAFVEKSPLSLAEQADELLLMGLRIEEGVDLDRLAVLTGRRIEGRAIARLEELGMLAVLAKTPAGPSRIAATADGRMVLNSIVTELAARMHAPAPEAATY